MAQLLARRPRIGRWDLDWSGAETDQVLTWVTTGAQKPPVRVSKQLGQEGPGSSNVKVERLQASTPMRARVLFFLGGACD